MDQIANPVIPIVENYGKKIAQHHPVRKLILFGSHAKNTAREDSDIDVGVVVDYPNHAIRIDVGADLMEHARHIDIRIEPKVIFWDEWVNREPASILAEIARTGKEIKIAG